MREVVKGIILTLFLGLLTQEVSSNCKIHSAKWIKGKQLKITIPQRADPGKVLVDWTNAIKNGRCADRFNVFVWETHRGEAFTRNYTAFQGTYSRIVDLDPCVEYKFKVGFFEKGIFSKEKDNTTVATFKTEASPTLASADKSKFVVQIYFDKISQKIDYSKASIKFPKTLLQHTSCLKHIEANGIENVATLTSSRGYSSHFNNLADRSSLSRSSSGKSTKSSRNSFGGSGQYGSTSSLSSTSSGFGGYGSFGTSGSFGGSGTFQGSQGGSSSFGGSGIVHGSSGSSSSFGGSGNYGGSSGKFLGKFKGTSGQGTNTPMDPHNYHDGHLHHDHSYGHHGRADFDNVSHGRYKRGLFGKTTTPSPSNYNLRSNKNKPGAHTTQRPVSGSTVSAKILPPFVEDVVEIVVPIKPCSSYTFSVKFVSPQGATLGTVKDLKLLQLSEIHNYHPPTLTEIFKVGKPTSANAPFISLQSYSGIPVECVYPILKAADRHMGHLEDELHFHLKKEFESIDYGNKMKSKFIGQKEHSLESAGCECSTPILHFNTTDTKQLKEHKNDGVFGTFVYEGMQNGKPYYRRPPTGMDTSAGNKKKKQRSKRFVGKVDTNSRSGSFSGGFSRPGSPHSSSSDSHLVIPNTPIIKDPPPPGKVYYVYWNAQEKAWWVGTSLQSNKPMFKTAKNSPAKCPGDTKTVKKWETKHTFSWKIDPHMVMTCKKQFH